MGTALGHDFSRVRVHTGGAAAATVRSYAAEALTFGEHVAFASGRYQPENPIGDALLAHELAHVVQQAGAGPAPQLMSATPAPGAEAVSLETEADAAAAGAVGELWFGRKQKNPPRKRSGPPGLRLASCGSNRNRFPPVEELEHKTISESESPFGAFEINHGVHTAPTLGTAGPAGWGRYHIDITMNPNERTSRAADIGFLQVARVGDSPTHPITTSPPLHPNTPALIDTDATGGRTPTGFMVDQPFYQAPFPPGHTLSENTPFYGYNRSLAGAYNVANSSATRAPGHYGRPPVPVFMRDRPTIADPLSFQARTCATCMTPQAAFPDERGRSYGCIDWGFFFDGAHSVWREEEPTFYLEDPFGRPDERQLGMRGAVDTWNQNIVPIVPGAEAARTPYTIRALVREGIPGGASELRTETPDGTLSLSGVLLFPPGSRTGTSTMVVLRSNVQRNDHDGTRTFMTEVVYARTRGWVPSEDLEETHS